MGKYYNLEGHTGEVSLDTLFTVRKSIEVGVQHLFEEHGESSVFGGCYEGNGFNIVFPFNGKDFFLRCELDNRREKGV